MASPVQVVSNFEASSTTCVVTLASTGAGNTIVAVVYAQNAITAVETGTETTGWAARQTTSGADAGTITIWSQPGTEGGDTSVTVTQAAAGQIGVYVFELPGICNYDTGNTGLGNGAGTTWTSGSTGTTASASEFWVGAMGGFNDAGTNPSAISGPASPWTNEAVVHSETGVFLISGWRETTTTGTAVYNGTTTGVTAGNFFYGAAVATFAEGGSPSGATTSGGLAVLPGEIFAFTPGPVTASGRLAAITPAITAAATVSNPPSGTNPSWDPAGSNAVGGTGYELTFNDNFTSINTDVWTLGWQATTGISGPINAATDPGVDGEAAAYDSANCTISGGSVLSMAMVHTNVVSGGVTYPWSGACMTTNPTTLGTGLGFQQTGGCFEARINLPVSGGVLANWPAWWLDGQTWPADGEIDIMEGLGGNAQWHSWSTPNDPGVGSSAPGESPSASNYGGWHTYGVSWDASAGQMDYYYDGVLIGSIASGVADSPNYLILDYTTGWFSGPSVAGDMLVDWIRVWEQPTTPAPPQGILQLADNFPSTADLYSKWTGEGLTVSANQVAIQCDPDYDGFLQSGTIYNFTNGTFSAEVTNPTGTIETGMILSNLAQDGGATFTDSVSWGYDGTNLVASITQSAAATTVATLTYSATTHKWWRMSETAGTGISWYTSPNGTAWTLQGSHAHTMVTSNLFAEFYTGNDGSGTLSTFIAAVNGGSAPTPAVTSAGGLGALAAAAGGAVTYVAPPGADVTAGGLARAPLAFAGTALAIPPVVTTSGHLIAAAGVMVGVAPASVAGGVEVFANTPTGTVTSGGTDAPVTGTVEAWTVNVTRAFAAASQSTVPGTFFYATDPADTTDELFLVFLCPGGTGTGQTWLVQRGADGSAPVTHAAGFAVTQVVTRASLVALQDPATWPGVNVVTAYGADPTGATDCTTAFASALATGHPIVVPAGTFLFTSSSPLAYAAAGQQILGAGQGATVLKIGAGFTAAELFSCAGFSDCGISDLTILSASGQWNTAPAMTGIEVTHSQRFRITNVRGWALNGWLAEIVSDATGDSYYPVLDHVTASFCAQGVHLVGTNSTDHLMGAFLTNCTFEENENGPGLLCTDVVDLTSVNLEISPAPSPVGGGVPGVPLTIQGDCISHFYSNTDGGAVLIEASGTVNPYGLSFHGGIISGGSPGIAVTAGTEILVQGMQINANQTSGIAGSGSAGRLVVQGCIFDNNNAGGGTAAYDLSWDGTGVLLAQSNLFATGLGTATAHKVPSACQIISGAGSSIFQNNMFNGAAAFNTAGGFPGVAKGNQGFNPTGSESTPSIPASGTALTSPYGEDCAVYITAGSTSTCGVTIGTQAVMTIAAGGVGTVFVAQSQKITLTYSSAPTWAWNAN